MTACPRRLLPFLCATALLAACEPAPAPAPSPAGPAARSPPPAAAASSPLIPEPSPQQPLQRPPRSPPEPVRASGPPPASDNRLPLVRILSIAQRAAPGEVISVDLDEDDHDDPPTYELEILTPEGRVVEIKLDARNGRILEIEED